MTQATILRSAVIMMLLITGVTVLGFKPSGYIIKGNVTASNGILFYLHYQYNGKQIKDSATVLNNQFQFKGTLPEPVICTLNNSVNHQMKLFVAENAEIDISGSIEKIFSAEVRGATEDALYNEFKQKGTKLSSQYRAMVKASGADLHDKNSEPYKIFHGKLDSLAKTFVKSNSSGVAAALAIIDCYVNSPDRPSAKLCYALLSEIGKQGYYAKRILQFINAPENINIGQMAPDFVLKNLKGENIHLSNYRGNYVFIDFWASWCGPCRAENPGILRNYKNYGSRLKFLGVSMDASSESWKKAVETDQLPWEQVNDPESTLGEIAALYGIKSLPFNLIINPSGMIMATNLRGDALTRYLEAYFK